MVCPISGELAKHWLISASGPLHKLVSPSWLSFLLLLCIHIPLCPMRISPSPSPPLSQPLKISALGRPACNHQCGTRFQLIVTTFQTNEGSKTGRPPREEDGLGLTGRGSWESELPPNPLCLLKPHWPPGAAAILTSLINLVLGGFHEVVFWESCLGVCTVKIKSLKKL